MQLQRLFERYNERYFGGRLPAYQIVRSDRFCRGKDGKCRKKQREIHLGTALHGRELKEVLLHEMAHAAVPRSGHGKAWKAVMLRLEEMGAPTRRDLRAYQDPKKTLSWASIKCASYDCGLETDMPWRMARPQIGQEYGLTDVLGRSESPSAAKQMQQLRNEFKRGRRSRSTYLTSPANPPLTAGHTNRRSDTGP